MGVRSKISFMRESALVNMGRMAPGGIMFSWGAGGSMSRITIFVEALLPRHFYGRPPHTMTDSNADILAGGHSAKVLATSFAGG